MPAATLASDIMKHKELSRSEAGRTFAVVLEPGEEVFAGIQDFARTENVSAASLTAIGAFKRAVVGWFDFSSKSYRKIPVNEQCEVLSALGDIALDDHGRASLHVHAVLGLQDGTTRGGHLLEGYVNPTLEVIINETPAHLHRRKRPDLGIALIDI